MAILKCKMCGGELNIQDGMTVAECEYCGTKQTVPTADNEKKMTLFARANRLRAACEFDKAAGVYESIVAEFPEEAEAYWGLILCKYGIEYVDDPTTAKKIPTCHRSSFDSIMEDSDFEMVMEYADPIARRVYREEAKAIEELRKGIIEVSNKEEPYDIFICYKETDENGNRTIDSVIAQDIYKELTNEGYRVFFARISLEDKLGTAYEPYIFAALNSAKVMLAIGTDYDCYNAVWVKNEWSRFLSLIAKGEKKTLIPCYKDIDAYDIPKEFKHLQAQDMGKVGAMQDLLRGIGKILGVKSQPVVTHLHGANAESETMKQRGYMALEDGEIEEAKRFFERALDINPSDRRAYLGKFLAQYGLASLADFDNKVIYQPENNKQFKRAEQFADSALANELRSFKKSNEIKIERLRLLDVLKKRLKKMKLEAKKAEIKERTYLEACELQALGEETKLAEAAKIFDHLNDYKDSSERANECQKAYGKKKAEREGREKKEREEKAANEKQIKDATIKRLAEIRDRTAPYRNLIAAGDGTTFGVNEEGKVIAVGDNGKGQCSVSEWSDVVAVSSSVCHTVGLKSNGTVLAVGVECKCAIVKSRYEKYAYTCGELAVSDWNNIIAIAGDSCHTVGIKSNGTVVATKYTGEYYDGQCDVSNWKDIVAITAGRGFTIGLKSNGKVEVAGDSHVYKVLEWDDIVAVSSGSDYVIGLKSDGTVVATGIYRRAGSYKWMERNDLVADWIDIVAVAAGSGYIVGLKSDGTVITTEYTGDRKSYYGQCDVSNWKDIVAIAAGNSHTIGLKADGTVVAVGQNDYGQCDVSGWKLFKSEDEKESEYKAACRLQNTGTWDNINNALNMFNGLGNYKDSPTRAKWCYGSLLTGEKSALQKELANLKGLFTGRRRKEIEARLAQIESELNKL